MANLINLEQVSKTYGLKTLLDGVSLGVQSGDRIGIVGVNGGGKNTLLGGLTRIEPPPAAAPPAARRSPPRSPPARRPRFRFL